jgi:hypothetical protein
MAKINLDRHVWEDVKDYESLYQINQEGVVIQSTGVSIMESKLYSPLPENERQGKLGCINTQLLDK